MYEQLEERGQGVVQLLGEIPRLEPWCAKGCTFTFTFSTFYHRITLFIALTGLTLMGFKPRSKLKRHFYTKASNFIYPDESVSISYCTHHLNSISDTACCSYTHAHTHKHVCVCGVWCVWCVWCVRAFPETVDLASVQVFQKFFPFWCSWIWKVLAFIN